MLTRITGIYRKIVGIATDLDEPIDDYIWISADMIRESVEMAYNHLVKNATDA